MPTSAQHAQGGPVSKDGSTQLSWLTDPKWLFHFTCHPQILRWLQDPVSSVPSSLYFSDLISPYSLLYHFTPVMVGSWVFLKPTRPAASFQPCIGFFPPLPASLLLGSSSLCPSRPPTLCSDVTLSTSEPWSLFKNFNLPLFYLGILNLKPLSLMLFLIIPQYNIPHNLLIYYKQMSINIFLNEWIKCFFIWHKRKPDTSPSV